MCQLLNTTPAIVCSKVLPSPKQQSSTTVDSSSEDCSYDADLTQQILLHILVSQIAVICIPTTPSHT